MLFCLEAFKYRAEGLLYLFDGSYLGLSELVFELGEGVLDGIRVEAPGR